MKQPHDITPKKLPANNDEQRVASALIDNCNIRIFENRDWSWHSVLYGSTRHGMSCPIGEQNERPADDEKSEPES